jgi:hypothetical protein
MRFLNKYRYSISKKAYEESSKIKLPLIIFDFLPVLLFVANVILLYNLFSFSILFLIGAVLIGLAGMSMIIYKIILRCTGRDLTILRMPMVFLMPIGFLLMIVSLFIMDSECLTFFIQTLLSLPYLYCATAYLCCLGLMLFYSLRYGRRNIRTNRVIWREELTNFVAHLSIFVLCMIYLFA